MAEPLAFSQSICPSVWDVLLGRLKYMSQKNAAGWQANDDGNNARGHHDAPGKSAQNSRPTPALTLAAW
jgi:hypothetical protein